MNNKILLIAIIVFLVLAIGIRLIKPQTNPKSPETLQNTNTVNNPASEAQVSPAAAISPVPTETNEQLLQQLNNDSSFNFDTQFKQLENELN